MQRILAADYRISQLSLSSTPTTNTTSTAPTTSNNSSSSEDRITFSSSTSPATPQASGPSSIPPASSTEALLQELEMPSTSSGVTRSRFHPYSRWMLRSRSSAAANLLPLAETAAALSIPLVRIDDVSPDESRDPWESSSSNSATIRTRPRSPPLPEIHQVLNANAATVNERFNLFGSAGGLLSADRAPQLRHPPPHHIWFSGGVGWPMAGPNPELGLLTSVGALNLTYRIQCWNFSNLDLPKLKDGELTT